VAAVVSLVTLVSMLKVWKAVFWDGEPAPAGPGGGGAGPGGGGAGPGGGGAGPGGGGAGPGLAVRLRFTGTVPALVLALLSLALGVGAAPLLAFADAAAAGLVDPAAYVRAVLR
jgi:multicomponent Na+:H+ antiporter subunit D